MDGRSRRARRYSKIYMVLYGIKVGLEGWGKVTLEELTV